MAEVCYPPGLLGVDEAIQRLLVLAREQQPAVVTLPLAQAAGHVLAADVHAAMDVPPQANSAMDGYAFCAADVVAEQPLAISQRIPAGQAPQPLQRGSAARIFTGAIVPPGADTVVMQENCEADTVRVLIKKLPEAGANIRPAGQDVARGSLLLARGSRLGPVALGLLASAAVVAVDVFQPLRVAVLSTGDELLEPGEAWRPAAIYNSNRPMLLQLLRDWGCEVLDLGRVADSAAATENALQQAVASKADVIISSGGVSVGEEDHVKTALQKNGELAFWKIAIKPGKPVAVGRIGSAIFLGLPGNPQSVWVTALLLARPLLLARQGQAEVLPRALPVPAGFVRERAGDRREYLRVQLQDSAEGLQLLPHPQQSSGALMSAAWAHGLAAIEAGQIVKPGTALPFLPFSTLIHP
ncbi:MAG TPA: gephyrin-like molybdotransferase Glp [Moraxellaceae bacterium]